MSLPHTLVVDEHGEERTIFDHRFHDPRTEIEIDLARGNLAKPDPFYQRMGLARIQWWHVVVAFVVLVMLCAPSIVAYRQYVKARALRAAIAELTSVQSLPQRAEQTRARAPLPYAPLGTIVGSAEAPAESATRSKDRVAMERRGADLLAANDYVSALEHYRSLAAAFPDDPAFGYIVLVLESKQSCLGPSPTVDGACR